MIYIFAPQSLWQVNNYIKYNYNVIIVLLGIYVLLHIIDEIKNFNKKNNKYLIYSLLFAVVQLLDIIFGVLGGIGFIILHNRITKYHCHHCNEDFKLSIIETVIAEDKGDNGRKTVCKNCNEKDYYKAVRERL